MPTPPLSILIITTQTWLQVTRLCLRFSRYGCKVSALCPEKSELRLSDSIHACHSFRGPDPLVPLASAIEASQAEYLVPCDDLAVWLLHELSARFAGYRSLVERSVGASRSFSTVRSRCRLLSLADELGITTPETAQAPRLEDALAWSETRGLPFLLKKDGTWGGGGVEVVRDRAELPHHYQRLNSQQGTSGKARRLLFRQPDLPRPGALSCLDAAEVSVQAYVEGVAANAMFACSAGKILGSVHARVVAAKGRTGPALMIELIEEERMERAGRLLASSLELSGFFGLDFILEQGSGEPYLIEMNPRCTQLGHVALAQQTDLAGLLWADWTGNPCPQSSEKQLGSSVCFYPQAAEWAPECSFLSQARLDVCAADLEIVDRLAQGSQALLARTRRGVREQIRAFKRSIQPPAPTEVFYFEPAAAPAKRQEMNVPSDLHARPRYAGGMTKPG